jgi:hypothetical protein
VKDEGTMSENNEHIDALRRIVGSGDWLSDDQKAFSAAINALSGQDRARGMDDGAAMKDASRLLMSLNGDDSVDAAKSLIVRYLRSYFEAGYSVACAHFRSGDPDRAQSKPHD